MTEVHTGIYTSNTRGWGAGGKTRIGVHQYKPKLIKSKDLQKKKYNTKIFNEKIETDLSSLRIEEKLLGSRERKKVESGNYKKRNRSPNR
jgi:hypothetical protein